MNTENFIFSIIKLPVEISISQKSKKGNKFWIKVRTLLGKGMYTKICYMQELKEVYEILKKEISRIGKLDKVTLSGFRKHQQLPKLEERKKCIKKEFEEMIPQVREWVDGFKPEDKWMVEVFEVHYFDINKLPEKLQYDLELLGIKMRASNFRALLKKIWLKQIR